MAEKSWFHVDAGSKNLPLGWQSYNVIQSTKKVTETTFMGLYRCEKLATRNENTAVNQQAKVGGKLRLRLWDQACKKSMELRVNVKKGAVMIVHVHVLSCWLASSYPIRCTFPQQNSWRVFVESAINNQKSSCHFTWRNGSMAAWMFVHPTNTAKILDLKGFLINQKLFVSTSEYHYYYQGRKRNMPDFWNCLNHFLPKVYRFIWSCHVFFY